MTDHTNATPGATGDRSLINGDLEHLWTGAEWSEGPLWVPQSQTVRFSDAINNRILQFDPATGTGSVYLDDAEYSNGRTLDLDGSVVQCSQGRRAIERDVDGTVTTIVDRWRDLESDLDDSPELRFNSPNDVVVDSTGSLWFTDPPYGIRPGTNEGREAPQEYDGCYLFRYADGVAVPMVTELVHPNGLAFSPDESILYIADTGTDRNLLYAWEGGELRLFKDFEQGPCDGFRVDVEGRIWSSAGDHVVVLAPDGTELLDVPVPERVANVCFGGPDGTDLYITASTSLYRLRTTTRDTAQHW
jgi:gluconolactonase